jgi:hypothetical protein
MTRAEMITAFPEGCECAAGFNPSHRLSSANSSDCKVKLATICSEPSDFNGGEFLNQAFGQIGFGGGIQCHPHHADPHNGHGILFFICRYRIVVLHRFRKLRSAPGRDLPA